jgi:hypothetical protein
MKIDLDKRLTRNDLLATRICDLGVSLSHNKKLQKKINTVCYELTQRGFHYFKPSFYLGDEWFSPEGVSAVSIPFYLSHPKLLKLEENLNGQAEGATTEWCLRLLRHEVGHCFDHAFKLSSSQEWKDIFGNPKNSYEVDDYSFVPHSRNYVINLENFYAQSHPEEDFAETFAVWLQFDKKEWESIYKKHPGALLKLKYVDNLCSKFLNKKPKASKHSSMGKSSRLRSTLSNYYKRRNLL